jgi:hypothetical protein
MLTLCATAVGIRFGGGTWATDHSPLLNLLILGTGLSALVMMILYFVTNDDAKTAPDVKKSAYAGGDNKGAQFGGGSVFGDSAIRELATLGREKPTPPPVERPTEQLLQFGRVEYATVRLDKGSIDKSETGEEGILLPVYNLTPKVLPRGRNYDLAAHIVFYEEKNIIANVARGYWLGKPYNDVELQIGDNAFVVLGTRHKPGVWTAWANRFVRPAMHFGNITIPRAEKNVFVVEREIYTEVTLVNIHSGEVVARCPFAISPNGDEAPAVRRL